MQNKSLSISTCRQRKCAIGRTKIKVVRGRSRKRHWWKNVLHEVLRDEFIRFHSARVKLDTDFNVEPSFHLSGMIKLFLFLNTT